MSGRVGDLTDVQGAKLKTLRTSVADVLQPHHDDYYLLRWLRARNFDVSKAEGMLRKHLEWRSEIHADTLLTEYKIPEVFEKYFPSGFLGFDKEGCPVRVIQFGNLDYVGAVNCLRTRDIVKCIAARFEEDIQMMEQQSKKLGKVIETHLYIADVKDVPMKLVFNKAVGEVILSVVKAYQENYPERLKKVFIINVSAAFNTGFKILKKFICPEVLKKYCLYGTDGWKDALLEDIDADVLPACLGGTRVDPDGDPRCPSVIRLGGPIPTTYYMKHERVHFCNSLDVSKIFVDKRDFALIDVSVDTPGTTLTWRFLTLDHDIGFGLYYRMGAEKEMEEIMATRRVECHLVPEFGLHHCTKVGTYVLQFDNRYSYIRPKEVVVYIDTKTPKPHGTEG